MNFISIEQLEVTMISIVEETKLSPDLIDGLVEDYSLFDINSSINFRKSRSEAVLELVQKTQRLIDRVNANKYKLVDNSDLFVTRLRVDPNWIIGLTKSLNNLVGTLEKMMLGLANTENTLVDIKN